MTSGRRPQSVRKLSFVFLEKYEITGNYYFLLPGPSVPNFYFLLKKVMTDTKIIRHIIVKPINSLLLSESKISNYLLGISNNV